MEESQAFAGRIPYSDSLLRQLESKLSVCIANAKNRVRLCRKPKAFADHFYCGLHYPGDDNHRRYIQQDERAAEWVLTKAIRSGASVGSVWIGIRLRFDSEGEDAYLTAASVVVLAQRAELFPLVRAEWDYRGVRQARHAQPHWHVLTALQARAQMGDMGDFPADFVSAAAKTGSNESETLHLAMSTDWQDPTGNRHICGLPAVANLRNWLVRTVEYSVDQVQYALNKVGAVSESGPQEFRPSPP